MTNTCLETSPPGCLLVKEPLLTSVIVGCCPAIEMKVSFPAILDRNVYMYYMH